MNLSHWVKLTFGRTTPLNQGQQRYARILQALISGLAGRIVGVVVSFISVPLTLGYLGGERYGVWISVSTLLTWFQLADLGLGNSLKNALTEAYAKNQRDDARAYLTTAIFLLSSVTVAVGGLAFLGWYLVDWNALFNVHTALARDETPAAMAVALLLFLLNFPLASILPATYTAHQEGVVANFWLAFTNVSSLIAILLATQWHFGLVGLVLAFSGSQLLITLLSAWWLFGRHKPWLRPGRDAVRRDYLRPLANVGGRFFVIQLAGLLIFQTDNLIIAYFAGAERVTAYSVAYRLVGYTNLLQLLIFPNMWTAYGEALANRDIAWVRRTFRLNMLYGTLTTLALVIPFILFGPTIIRLWAGNEALPPPGLLLWLGVWSIINAAMSVISSLLSSSGQIQNQMVYALVTAGVNIGLSILFVNLFGVTGVIAGTVIAYLVCNVVPASLDTNRLLKRLSNEV